MQIPNDQLLIMPIYREFLRLGDPLNCISMDEMEAVINSRPTHRAPGGPVPLTRIKTLVSMTTPRDFSSSGYVTSTSYICIVLKLKHVIENIIYMTQTYN